MIQARRMNDVRRWIERRTDRIATVSFDVFDTLLARRIHPPEIVHERVAMRLAEAINHSSWPAVLEKRYEVERWLREKASKDAFDHECDIGSILDAWLASFNIHDPILKGEILAYELKLERSALYLQHGALELLRWLHAQKLKLFAISDVYLNSKYLVPIFEDLQISNYFEGIYSSADRKICKYSSRLFELLIQEQNIDPLKHLHIGDNRVSDYSAPRKARMQAMLFHDPHSILRRKRLEKSRVASKDEIFLSGKYFHQIMTDGNLTKFSSFYHQYGYEILAPIFSLFGLGLAETLKHAEYDWICFLSRDGHLLQKVTSKFIDAGWMNPTIKTKMKYMHVSRRACFAAMAADGLTVEQARIGLYSPTQKGLASILQTFSLPLDAFQAFAIRHGFDEINKPIQDFNDPRLVAFFQDSKVQQIIKRLSEDSKTCLLKYFQQEGIWDANNVAFVDIGWNGTIQYSLSRLTQEWKKRPVIDGYYFAYSSGIGYKLPPEWQAHGIIYDKQRKHPGERSTIHFEELFEEAARSLESTTIGYEILPITGMVRPVHKSEETFDRKEERKRDQEISDLQTGILEGCDQFISSLLLTGLTFNDLKPFFTYHLERALVYPSVDEVHHLSRLTHSTDFGIDEVMDLESIGSRRVPIYQLNRWLQETYSSDWVYGKVTGLLFNLPRYFMRIRELNRLRNDANV